MKSFLSSLRKLDSSAHVLRDRIAPNRQHQLLTTLLLSGAIIGGSIGLMVSSLPALAGTTVSSTPSVSETGEAIGYTVDAVSLSNSYGTQTCTLTASRNFNITLPLGATVRKAILYWATDKTGGDSQVTLAGSTINATQSWNDQIQTTTKIFYGYRANVTSQITGAGTYSFSGLGGDLTSPFVGGCVSGASLIVIYDTTRSDPKALNRIEMFDGFEGIRGAGLASGGASSTVTLPINSLGSDSSFMTALSWQGNFINEPPSVNGYPDTLTVNGTGVFNTNNPVNDNGNGSGANQAPNSVYAVDADTYDISSIVGNSTSLTITNTSGLNDYVISQGFIFGSRGPDVSDAPGSYGIARHKILPTLNTATPYLGSKVDGEVVDTAYTGSTNADFDDTNGTDDDDGITFPTLTAGDTSYSIPASNITASGTGTLHAWIDFNKNGTFETGEYKNVAVTNNTPVGALTWTNILAGAAGNTFARFRFTTDATVTASTPSGLAANGEVEDSQVPIVAAPTGIRGTIFEDYGTGTTGDNIKQSAENGISGVGVSLYLDDGDQIFEPGAGDTLAGTTQVSSTTGAYTFPGLTSGQLYWVKADAAAATNRVYGGLTGNTTTAIPNPRLVVFNGVDIVADFPFDAGHIGVAKIQANVERTKATIDFVIKNYGPVALTNIELIDNLDLAFTAGNYTIAAAPIIQVAPTMGSTITPATNFNGATNQNLLNSTNSQLQVGESVTVRLEVNVTNPTLGGDGAGNYLNNAIVNGRTPSGIVITDKSTQSANPDRDNVTPDGSTVDSEAGLNDQDGDPTNNNSPTVVSVTGTNTGGICASPNGLVFSVQGTSIYAVDVNSGKAKIVAGGGLTTAMNGAATNHMGHLVYYADGNSLYAWDSINNQHTTITSQFQTVAGINISGFNLGSGGAAFYNGSLYQGVDQGTFEIYKIDFVPGSDGRTIQSIAPVGIANLVATGKLTGTVNWGDFIISDTGLIVANGNGTQYFWSYDLNTNTFVDLTENIPFNSQLAKDGQGRLWGLGGANTFQVQMSGSTLSEVAGTRKSTLNHSSSDAAECAVGVNTIGDRVWNDTDGDGVQDPGEAGIGNVTIDLYWDLDDDGVIDAGEPVLETQTTNSNGNYDFTQLLFGRYIVKVSDRNNVLSTATLTTTSATLPVLLPTGRIDYNDADFGYRLTTLKPNLLLVKRITAINGLPRKNDGGSIAGYEHFDAYDNNFISIPTRPLITDPQKDTDKWPNTTSTSETNTTSTFLVGATNGGTTKPNDTIDYTIYFLSAGESEAKNVLFCDRVPTNVTFSPNTFTNTTANPGGIARGIALQLGNTLNYYTNTGDSDPARYFPPGIEPSTVYPSISCGKDLNTGLALPNDNGAVVVNLGDRPKATGILADDQAAGAYGFVRFRGIVK